MKKPCVISLAVWVCGSHTACNVLFLFILKRLVVTWHAAAVCYMDSQLLGFFTLYHFASATKLITYMPFVYTLP